MAVGYLETDGSQHIEGADVAPPSNTLEIITLVQDPDYSLGTGHRRMISKDANTTQREYRFLLESTGGLRYQCSSDGSSYVSKNSSVAHGRTDGVPLWCRVVHSLTTGDITFYTSADSEETAVGSVTWTQLGTVQTGGTTSIFNGTAPIRVGGEQNGDPIDRTFGAWVFHNGVEVANPDARDDDQGWSSPPATDDHAISWSLVNGATWVAPTGVPVSHQPPPGLILFSGPPPVTTVVVGTFRTPPPGFILWFSPLNTSADELVIVAPNPGLIVYWGSSPTVALDPFVYQPPPGLILLFGPRPTHFTVEPLDEFLHEPPPGIILFIGFKPNVAITGTSVVARPGIIVWFGNAEKSPLIGSQPQSLRAAFRRRRIRRARGWRPPPPWR